jgi:hypothetical protein
MESLLRVIMSLKACRHVPSVTVPSGCSGSRFWPAHHDDADEEAEAASRWGDAEEEAAKHEWIKDAVEDTDESATAVTSRWCHRRRRLGMTCWTSIFGGT